MSEDNNQRLSVFCDVCWPQYKTLTMKPGQIKWSWRYDKPQVLDGYICDNPGCRRIYTQQFGYENEGDSPRERLRVPCGCDSSTPPMYIDEVRKDGSVRFRCWRCEVTQEAENPRTPVSQSSQ